MSRSRTYATAEKLNHLQYHWFWGLRYNRDLVTLTQFGKDLHQLLADSNRLSTLKKRYERFQRQAPIIRFLFWLLNIDNYSYESYLLGVCDMYQELKRSERVVRLSSVFSAGYEWAFTRIKDMLGSTTEMAITSLPTSSASKKRLAPAVNLTVPVGDVKPNPTITIDYLILPYLETLAIKKGIGDTLCYEEFKRLCRRQYLLKHPDKGGSEEEFCLVKEAIDHLNGTFFPEESEAAYGEVCLAEFKASLDALVAEDRALRAKDKEENRALRAAFNAEVNEHLTQLEKELITIAADAAKSDWSTIPASPELIGERDLPLATRPIGGSKRHATDLHIDERLSSSTRTTYHYHKSPTSAFLSGFPRTENILNAGVGNLVLLRDFIKIMQLIIAMQRNNALAPDGHKPTDDASSLVRFAEKRKPISPRLTGLSKHGLFPIPLSAEACPTAPVIVLG